MSDYKRTLHAVASLLGGGGWNDEVSNTIRRWWRRNRMTEHRKKRLERGQRAFQAMVTEKLDDRDRLVLGRYIGLLVRQHFDAGLTMGLLTRLDSEEKS